MGRGSRVERIGGNPRAGWLGQHGSNGGPAGPHAVTPQGAAAQTTNLNLN